MSVAQISDLNDLKGTTIYPGQRLILSGEEAGYHKIIAGSFSKKENAEKRAALLKKKRSLPQLAPLSLMAKPITVCRLVHLKTKRML
ncbi:LysM peptidoglycan-binding domain-containing protein [Cytobacillus pseudoceanisediminis]|uniref:LysM peptidoglycan-binding domain-containing protein n=1 Tax=Cytobacillus pseudoceanisediminis TaxID=3051614 RepID=UPI00218C5958|nr:LysM peptidoglycan-binding domain-containing protein [Cytobacillus pseudoceanisediminis]UQX55454.1 LysM peptidoglycan-binding domain-containing protein [Cytobacillus pseudoceanisediminis]